MRKQILTALGVLIIGSTAAFASPLQYRGNFNDQRSGQIQQQQNRSHRGQYGQYSRTPAQPVTWQQSRRQKDNRPIQNHKKHRRVAQWRDSGRNYRR
jgi:hypothetical protein